MYGVNANKFPNLNNKQLVC